MKCEGASGQKILRTKELKVSDVRAAIFLLQPDDFFESFAGKVKSEELA